ncbi:hypothetical protein TESG_01200 [Trichophyton tonsurans CBS 112818]|uniref:Uncharacterized protein n=1 Tax=Trichophyton tonsurans (strain CBS 112818) TaxID=647933 RepID=F2RQR0_TRIT1|nr:hypothetical protein TESG_01200 [Trichophyton tonsurans CBS 112818]
MGQELMRYSSQSYDGEAKSYDFWASDPRYSPVVVGYNGPRRSSNRARPRALEGTAQARN